MTISIHSRILFSALITLVLFLGLTGLVLDEAFRNNLENAQKENLRTQVYTLLATAELGSNSQLVLPAEITEPRLNIAESSLHARVITPGGNQVWASKSMLNTNINFPVRVKVGEFVFSKANHEQDNFTILSFATLWVTDQGEQQYIFQVAENQKVLQRQVNVFRHNLWGWLVGVSLVLLLVQAVILRWGLKPLRHVAEDLLRIEQGHNRRLAGNYPKEITPLTNNLNQLLDTAQQQLGRYRDALGNMAHSLKTPIAVLRGIIDSSNLDQKPVAEEQLQTINNIVEYQLQRAATAGRQQLAEAVPLYPVAEKVIQTLQKVYKDKQVDAQLDVSRSFKVRIDEADLFELLGNLLENAFKWCEHKVYFTARDDKDVIRLVIEDDGPGIAEAERKRILQRGQRADQGTPGHGLGMAMVSDMLLLYQAQLQISDSPLGGTRITILL
ncbi:MAG: ATP-binding protein [Thioalkalispiraceae bacterium]